MSIQKFSGSFSKQESGVTILHTKTIQSITCGWSLAIYTYLATKPDNWVINIRELSNHFKRNKETIYKYIKHLMSIGALIRTVQRIGGRFQNYHYQLRLTLDEHTSSPVTEKPETVLPETVNPDTYKAEKLQNKESNNIYIEKKEVSVTETKKDKQDTYLQLVLTDNPHALPKEMIKDWLQGRKAKRAPLTKTAVSHLNRELHKCVDNGLNAIEVFDTVVSNGWLSVRASIFNNSQKKKINDVNNNETSWIKGVFK